MKNQELRKILGIGAVLLAFFIAECEGSGDVCGKDGLSVDKLSIGGKRKACEISNPTSAASHMPPSVAKKQKKEKRSLKEVFDIICEQKTVENTEGSDDNEEDSDHVQDGNDNEGSNHGEDGDDERSVQDNHKQVSQPAGTRRRQRIRKVENNGISLWNNRRLDSKRRKGYKITHQTIYNHQNTEQYILADVNVVAYQEKLKNKIKEFSAQIASSVKKSPMWFFVASEAVNINNKYKLLFGMKELFKTAEGDAYKKMVESLEGYYPDVIGDMIEYVHKHHPLRLSKRNPNVNVWKETLGDIYLRREEDLNFCILDKQEEISKIDERCRETALALQMILMLPEVYQDFSAININQIYKIKTAPADLSENTKNENVLLAFCRIAKKISNNKEQTNSMYMELYSCLSEIHSREKMLELKAADLYREIYTIIGRFYEQAYIFDENNTILTGKCMITNQKYRKCEIEVELSSEEVDKRVQRPNYSFEENRWTVSPDVHEHYHVYYVDNATNQLRLLCMPVYKDVCGRKHYLHTINDIVDHIKNLYEMKIELDHIHPFKLKKQTRNWSYVKKKERNKTIKDLEEYEIVFYRIEEDLKKKFTFAEFRHLDSAANDDTLIPLFLTSLMRSAVDLGPFKKKEEHTELNSIEFENTEPSVYIYDREYAREEYSDVQSYYRNLHILPDIEKGGNVDCYIMGLQTDRQPDSTVKAAWYVKMPSSVDEYTHCVLGKAFKGKENSRKLDAFIAALESRKCCKDSELQAVWLQNNSILENGDPTEKKPVINIWLPSRHCEERIAKKNVTEIKYSLRKTKDRLIVAKKIVSELGSSNKYADTPELLRKKNTKRTTKSKLKVKLDNLYKQLYIKISRKPSPQTELIVFRNANSSKSNLGAHNEILDAFISCYRCSRDISNK
ncbi:hypothetical protein NEMIN01_0450 [Nematocida minor]|uniref:uncharacterized protein n=1 Tax=Nematocida minor TaxID=1912983 RepID=UPI002220AD55|nr:uncharacterized protein NEMIN01_0450 [Nematocida minor]KAI5189387.1 hypothetical protein NEMIN01_0450 [Nematocida minor]